MSTKDQVTEATAADKEDEVDTTPPQLPPDDVSEGITEEELARLTPEERAALSGDDESEEEEDDADAEVIVVDDEPVAPVEAPAVAAPAPVPAQAPAAGADGDVVMAFPDVDPDAIDKQIGSLKSELKAARTRFDDGDMTGEEYDAEIERITEAVAGAQVEKREAAKAIDAFTTSWNNTAQAFAGQHPEVFAEEHIAGFDREVRAITGDPAFDGMTHKAKLNLALDRYRITANAMGKPLAETKADPVPPKTGKKRGVSSALGEIPLTLARVPAASANTPADGRYGQLQALIDDPTTPASKIEKIMASMSDEERSAFASMDL